jgi:hypothetical protein
LEDFNIGTLLDRQDLGSDYEHDVDGIGFTGNI